MSLVTLLVILVVLAVIAWVINAYLPGEPRIKQIAVLVIVLVALFIVLQAFGVCDALRGVAVPHV